MVLPRETSNPYQELLYGALRRRGVQVSYVGASTRSHTANLLLLPFELAVHRISGARVLHIHWVYNLGMSGWLRKPYLNRAAEAWFGMCLLIAQGLGLRVVWTAHNVLPHSPVFADDLRARRKLVSATDLVIVHSEETVTQLGSLGLVPRLCRVIPHGPFTPPVEPERLRVPGSAPGPRRLLFFGKVSEYKGVEELLTDFATVSAELDVSLTVTGECRDLELRARLTERALRSHGKVILRLQHVPDGEVTGLLNESDVVVLPYRKITTSGSAMLAMSHGRPLVVPDIVGLADLPDEAVIRYDGSSKAGLAEALDRAITADSDLLGKMSAAAFRHSASITWEEIAYKTIAAIHEIPGMS